MGGERVVWGGRSHAASVWAGGGLDLEQPVGTEAGDCGGDCPTAYAGPRVIDGEAEGGGGTVVAGGDVGGGQEG